MQAVLLASIIGLPWLGAFLVWITGDAKPKLQHTLAVVFSVAAGIAALVMIPFNSSDAVLTFKIGGAFGDFTFVPDGLGLFLAVIATIVGSLAVIFSVNYMKGEDQLGRYYSMMLLFIGGMAGLVLTSNLLLVFGFWEITALCSYALISFYNDDPKAVAGGIKALVITQLGGIGLLLFAALSYAYLGTFDINVFLEKANTLPSTVLAIMAFGGLAAAAAKSSQFPFHTWLPDAMEAPTPISALIHAATMVNAGVYLLGRFYPAFESVPGWRTSVMLVGLISALLAGIMAITANDLKRVLAYSTVSQLGYMVYGIGVGGVFATNFHLMSHAVFKALLFLAAGAVIHGVGTRDMQKMGGLGKQMPIIRNVFVIGAIALAGIPILNGFWSKEAILEAGLHYGPVWAYAVMVLIAGMTAFYTFRCVYLVFFSEARSDLHGHDAAPAMKVSLFVLAAGTLTTWLLAGPFSTMLANTLPHHHMHEYRFGELFLEVLTAPATYIALVVISLGLVCWTWREKLTGLANSLKWMTKAALGRFGFEHLNMTIVNITQGIAEGMRVTQTGQLSWNVLGIIAGLVIILTILSAGA